MRSKEFWVKQLGEDWTNVLKPILRTEYMEKLLNGLQFDYQFAYLYPVDKEDVFKAFRLCSWNSLKVVIIGTEPSPLTGTSSLAFSNDLTVHNNPSACLIRDCIEREYKQLNLDFDFTFENWAKQGVLMLNRSLTCYKGESKSHRKDWKQFFGTVIYKIEELKPGTIFLLWGKEAKKYAEILSINHHVFTWEHPMTAFNQYRNWECPNFKQVDKLIEHLHEKQIKW